MKAVKVADNLKNLLGGSMSHWKTVLKSNGEVLVNALFIVEVHLDIKLVYRHPTFFNNDLIETIQT